MGTTPEKRLRILFVAEAITLAHFARPVTLARMLDPAKYDIFLASDPRYLSLIGNSMPFTFKEIRSIPSSQFLQALKKGKPVYDSPTLAKYVEDDLRLLNELQPALVIGDFRLSLAISAPKMGIPYASIVNSYWSPYANIRYTVPHLPQLSLLGDTLAQMIFNLVRPLVFAIHSMPLNMVRRRYGLPSLGPDLRSVYSWADYTLYADISEAVPMTLLPPNHTFLGPVYWSPEVETPSWWNSLPEDRPIVYISTGSSGQRDLLPVLLQALSAAPVTIIASTAGRNPVAIKQTNLFIADYLPGEIVTRKAQLVICNGGNMTTYQALALGVPVLGIATNMDQLLNMQAIERLGAGIVLRTERVNENLIKTTVSTILNTPSYTKAASETAETLSEYDTKHLFREFVNAVLD